MVLAHVALPLAVAAAAALGAWRCARLLRYGRDARLERLLAFYALFAASLLPLAAWTWRVAAEVHEAPGGLGGLHEAFVAAQHVDGWLVAHHVLMLASLGVAVLAFGRRGAASAAVGAAAVLLLAPFVPLALAAEAGMTAYLALRAVLNHLRRRTPGALQVAAGFALFFVGHLSFLVFHHPGAARTPLGEALSLAGIVLLVRLLPRPSA